MIVSTPYLHMSEYLKLIYSEFPDICTSLICLNIRTMVNFQALITNHTYVWKIHSLIKFFSRQMENIGKFGILVRLQMMLTICIITPPYRGLLAYVCSSADAPRKYASHQPPVCKSRIKGLNHESNTRTTQS